MADPPDLRFLWPILVYAYTALRPLLTEHIVSKLARGGDALWILLVKRIHHRVCDGERLILEGRVVRESRDELAEGGKVPKKAPSFHIGYDQIGRSELEVPVRLQIGELRYFTRGEETHIGWLDGVTVPRDTEHSVTSRLGNKRVRATFTLFRRDDVLDSPVATKSASDTYVRVSQYPARVTGKTTYLARVSHR